MSSASHLFNSSVGFKGNLIYGEDESVEVDCQAVVNPIDPSEMEVQISRPAEAFKGTVHAMKWGAQVSGAGRVQVEGELGNRQYLISGLVTRSQSNDQGTRQQLKVDDIIEVEISPSQGDKEGVEQRFRFCLPPFDTVASALTHSKSRHFKHGFIHGWEWGSPSDFESGEWESVAREMKVGDLSVEVGICFQFEQAPMDFAECEVVASQIRVEGKLSDVETPGTIYDVQSSIRKLQDQLMPFWSALRFVLGRRAYPTYQELFTFDYSNGALLKGRRFWNQDNHAETSPGRNPNAHVLWELVEELVDRFQDLDGDDLRRARKAVIRYVEAFEAPTLELKLTLMHSALHLILVGYGYNEGSNDVVPDEVPNPNGGSVNWALARFIGIHGIEWRDLFSDEVDQEEMYAFNRFRNDYLKRDRTGFMESVQPVKAAQRLFERVFLAHHGIDPSKYPALGRT